MSAVVLGPEDLTALLAQVWETYVDPQPLLPAATGEEPLATAWSATVGVTGAWEGGVLLELDELPARHVASRMLDLPVADEADVADAVGELANIVGGNVKSMMPEPSTLSLPQVVRGAGAPPVDSASTCHLALDWHGSKLSLTLFQTTHPTPEEEPTP